MPRASTSSSSPHLEGLAHPGASATAFSELLVTANSAGRLPGPRSWTSQRVDFPAPAAGLPADPELSPDWERGPGCRWLPSGDADALVVWLKVLPGFSL